jgi:hypothetical protein
MRWDIFAVIVALASIPFMLSSAMTWLLGVIGQRLMRAVWPEGKTCERLEWSDIPNGPLRPDSIRGSGLPHDHSYNEMGRDTHLKWFSHDKKDCPASTVGNIFWHAWISVQRRERPPAFKPYQLDPKKAYIQTDTQTLRAYAMLASGNVYNPIFEFKEIGGILTAHLGAEHELLPHITKEELDLILHKGYPPFYQEKIYTSKHSFVASPISSPDDITRGGWIVATGIDYYNLEPLRTHNMSAAGKDVFPKSENWARVYVDNRAWKVTIMAYSVKRFGHTLKNIQLAFPGDETVKTALSLFDDLIKDECDLSRTRPMEVLWDYPAIGRRYWLERPYIASLSTNQWQVAMNAFNHYEQLDSEETRLFGEFMKEILQAAFVGLLRVMLYGNHYRVSRNARKLPLFPELNAQKHIYLTTCSARES